jgi:hypothetical protein
MTNQGPFDNDNNQFVVSYELLQLFRWLFEHEQETLKKLMGRALRNGLHEKLYMHLTAEPEITDDLQQSIVDLFALLETLLYELINENEVQKVVQRNLIPALDHIDSTACDITLLTVSAAKATAVLEENPHEDPKDILCKELLKRWKPSKKLSIH